MITFESKGNFKNTMSFLERAKEFMNIGCLDDYGRRGVEALRAATPVDTGETASLWKYSIERTKNSVSVIWSNSSQNEGIPIVILLQYGHGTSRGAYVQGVDFINPAMRDIFQNLADEAWREVIGK